MDNRNWLSPFHNNFWGDRFFNQLVPKSFTDFFRTGNFGPSIDLQETDSEIVLQAEKILTLPWMKMWFILKERLNGMKPGKRKGII